MSSSSNNPPSPMSSQGDLFGKRVPHGGPQGHGHTHRQPRYVPNDQEARVLLECQRESFWHRALPFGLLTGTGAYVLIQRGILTTKTRFGPVPKVLFAGFCGYLLGKISYISTCKQKFLSLGSSPIADMIRKGASPGAIAAQFGRPTSLGTGEGEAETMFTGEGKTILGDDYNSSDSSFDSLDQDISLENYDNSGALDATLQNSPEVKKPGMTMTYDQLRKQNREKASQQYREVLPGHFQPKYEDPLPPKSPVSSRSGRDDDGFTLGRASKLRKNAYGDLISDE